MEASSKALHSLIGGGTQWRGPDAERFRSEWSNVSVRAITAAVESLRRAADELRRNADQQDQASAVQTASAAAGGVSAGDRTDAGPTGTAQLFEHIKNAEHDSDGVRIERVVGPDGESRLIVYLKGTDSSDNRDLNRNDPVLRGWVDPAITAKIDEALKGCPDGRRTDIMLVGYSQGGLDAQNLAGSGKYHVTNLVTFGTPIIQPENHGIETVHLHASYDPIPLAGAIGKGSNDLPPVLNMFSVASNALAQVPNGSNHVFEHDTGLRWDKVHGEGYPKVAEAFDNSTDPRFADVKKSMEKFQGTLVQSAD